MSRLGRAARDGDNPKDEIIALIMTKAGAAPSQP